MLALLKRLFGPPVFEEDVDKTRIAAIFNSLLSILALAALVSFAFLVAIDPDDIGLSDTLLGVAGGLFLFLLIVLRFGYVQFAGVMMLLVLWVGVTIPVYAGDGIRDTAITGYYLVVIVASLSLNRRVMFTFDALCLLASLGAYLAEVYGLIGGRLDSNPDSIDIVFLMVGLTGAAILLSNVVGNINAGFVRARRGTQALAESNRELQTSRDALDAQARQLERRTHYLEATAAVAREATSMLGVEELLARVVGLISKEFGYYHIAIFLLDPSGEWAQLQAASSEGGQRMLARGHQLRVGEEGIVGYVVGNGVSRVALDVGDDAVFFDNPDLANTHSEVALPLRARREIIGALDVQSTETNAFGEEDVVVLQALADQLALSISNARLFQQAQSALEAERRAYGELSRGAWRDLLVDRSDLGFVKEGGAVSRAEGAWKPEMEHALHTGEVTLGEDGGGNVAIPIKVRDQVIGVIDAHMQSEDIWAHEQLELLQSLAEQVGLALETARIYHDAQRRAAQELMLGQVMARVRTTLDMETMLKTAAQEIRQALALPEVAIRLAPSQKKDESGNGSD
jgi:GAF domain-containing protein